MKRHEYFLLGIILIALGMPLMYLGLPFIFVGMSLMFLAPFMKRPSPNVVPSITFAAVFAVGIVVMWSARSKSIAAPATAALISAGAAHLIIKRSPR